MSELETVWHGALWRRYPPPVLGTLADEAKRRKLPPVVGQPTPAKVEVMDIVRELGEASRVQVADRMPHKTYAAVSTAMDRLTAEGHLVRVRRIKIGHRNRSWLYRVREGQ